MSSTPGRVTKPAAKRRQCGNCLHSKGSHEPDPARYSLVRCRQGVTGAAWESRGGCICTQYREAWAVKPKVGAR